MNAFIHNRPHHNAYLRSSSSKLHQRILRMFTIDNKCTCYLKIYNQRSSRYFRNSLRLKESFPDDSISLRMSSSDRLVSRCLNPTSKSSLLITLFLSVSKRSNSSKISLFISLSSMILN